MAEMTDQRTTVAQLRDMMREFVAQRQWEKFHTPRNLAVSTAVESGELLELFQWLSDEASAARLADADFRRAVADEISDVLMYLLSLANTLHLDISAANTGIPAESTISIRPARSSRNIRLASTKLASPLKKANITAGVRITGMVAWAMPKRRPMWMVA